MRFAAVLTGLALLAVGADATTQDTQRTIYLSAVGGNGMPVVDPPIGAGELTVEEDGVPREILRVGKAEEPVYFAVLYETTVCTVSGARQSCEPGDNESNASNYVQQLREALNGFTSVVLAAAPTSKILLMDFGGAAVAKAELTSNVKDLEPILSKLVIQRSEPVLNEALMDVSGRMAKAPSPRRVILVVNREPTTDGSTSGQYKGVAEAVQKSGASVWALSVRYGTRQHGGRDQLLKGLAANSGGLRLTIGNSTQLGDYLRSVAANAIVQYAVTIRRPAGAPNAKLTTIKTTRQGVQPLTLQWSDK